jgi:NAD(P)H dehydrogenase (quinone)
MTGNSMAQPKAQSIAVTAASGRLGHAILRSLTGAAHRPVAVVRDPSRVHVPGCEIRRADYADGASMTRALAGIDTVIIVSAPVAGGGDRLRLHQNVVNSAVQAGVRKIIYTSIVSNSYESGTRFADFARINAASETLVRDSGCEWTIARNSLYLDLDLAQIRAAAATGVYSNGAGDGRCGYISIAELGFALATLARTEHCTGRSVNLSGPPVTQTELVDAANRVFGTAVRYEPCSSDEDIARLRSIPMIAARGPDVINMLAGCFQCIRNGNFDVPSDYPSVTGRDAMALEEQMQKAG